MTCRKLAERAPDFRAPEPDRRRETGDPLRDGYATVNRAQTDWRGRQRMPSYLKRDLPDEPYGLGLVAMYEDD